MKNLIYRFLVNLVAILVVAKLLPGIEVTSAGALVLTVVVLAVFNAILRPIMIFLTLPVTVLTLGLFIFVINGLILYLVSLLVDGFDISGVFVAVIASILISLVASVMNWLASE